MRDNVQGVKDQVQAIAVWNGVPKLYPPQGLDGFSAPAASKSSRDIHIALRCSPFRTEKSIPSNCFHLKMNGSGGHHRRRRCQSLLSADFAGSDGSAAGS
ncbi:MAG: hypothetical protein KAH44_07910, partial [Oricola sp.]|nr:hypothetical protein [Oricola sp.]